MRVLFVSQHFTPERTAAPLRLLPLARGLAERGHHVEVVCAVPNHPEGIVHEGFRGAAVVRRHFDGIDVAYVWVKASRAKDPKRRLVTFASFAVTAGLVGAAARRPSVIFASSPPLTVGIVGALLAKRFRVPWAFDVRDLWVEVAGSRGVVRSRRIVRAAARLEAWLYADAEAITVPTDAFRRHIARSTEAEKVRVLPNGTSEPWLSAGSNPVDRAELGLAGERFVWTFAGNVGLTQGLDTAVRAAAELGPGYQLAIIGDGASRARLEAAAATLPPGSVAFFDPVTPERAAAYMGASDALLVSLADNRAAAKTIPVKLYDSCAVGRPVVVAAPGEAKRLADELGIGLPVKPEDPNALADAIRTLRDDAGLRERLSAAGRRFAIENQREAHTDAFEALLQSVTGPRA